MLYLGYAVSKEEASKLYGVSIAGNQMQINVLEQLSRYPDIELKCITIYPTAAYPNGKKYIKRERICLFDTFYSLKTGLLNLPVCKHFFEIAATYIEAKRIVKKENTEIIFTFNIFPQTGLPAKWLKNKYGCKIVTLLADLPIDDEAERKGISLLLRKIFDNLTKKGILNCDKIITLNKYAVEKYAPGVDYIVVDGGIESEGIRDIPQPAALRHLTSKHMVYSGALVEYSGIMNLIDAMKYIKDSDVILDIYGSGQIENLVIQRANEMNNINYHGKIDHDQMKRIQSEAYLLINPRNTEHPVSQVTFPSKIFEYMMSGTPVLTTRLNGFSEAYFDKMFFVDDNAPFALAEKINEIVRLPEIELRKKALLARQFVIESKTWEKQCNRIYEFIKDVK